MESGLVLELEGDFAWVQLQENSACSTCSTKATCRPSDSGMNRLLVENPLQAPVGSKVAVAEKGRVTLKLSFLQFGLPLLSLLLGILLSSQLPAPKGWHPELFQSLCGVVFMLFSGVLGWAWAKSLASSGPLFEIVQIS